MSADNCGRTRRCTRGDVHAAMYTRGVTQMLAQMSRKMGGPVIEISEPGRLGVEIDEPSNRETLKLLPSDYSDVRLVSTMQVGLRRTNSLQQPNGESRNGDRLAALSRRISWQYLCV